MPTTPDPSGATGADNKWPAVDVSKGKPPHRGAPEPGFRLRGRGTAEGNVALCLLIQDLCRELGLETLTPPYGIVRMDPVTTNPVLEPAMTRTPESVALKWQTGGDRVTSYLGDAFRAIAKPVQIDRHSYNVLPVAIVKQPSGEPVLMLHYHQMSSHAVTKRGARTVAGAQRDAARANARLKKLAATTGHEPGLPPT